MQKQITIFIVLILLLQTIKASPEKSDASSCRLSSVSPSPVVIPWSSETIKVSWDKVFIGCKRQDVRNLEVKVKTRMNAISEHYAKVVESQANEVILDRSPCLKHRVYLVISFTQSKKMPLESSAIEYNKPLGQNSIYAGSKLYSGLLATEVVEHICLNKDGLTLTMPHVPEAIKDCVKTKTGIHSLNTDNEVKVGANVKFPILVHDPMGKAPGILLQPTIRNIQACTECKIKNNVPPKAKAYNSSHINVSWSDVFQGCKYYEVRDVTIIVDGQEILSKFDVNKDLIPGSPCMNHSIRVEINFKNADKKPLKSATISYQAKKNEFCRGAVSEASGIDLNVGVCYVAYNSQLLRSHFKQGLGLDSTSSLLWSPSWWP